MAPPLSYSIGRNFRWPWFPWFVYAGVLIVIPILVTLNYALTGYQDVTRLNSDYHVQQSVWYDRFDPGHKNRELCDPRTLAVGDNFVTSYNIFPWTITAVSTMNGSEPVSQAGVDYQGQQLQCAVYWMEASANVHSFSMAIQATVGCFYEDKWIYAITKYTGSSLGVGDYARFLQLGRAGSPAEAVGRLLNTATIEVNYNMVGIAGTGTLTGIEALVATGIPDTCTVEAPTGPGGERCGGIVKPPLNITLTALGLSTGVRAQAEFTALSLPYANDTLNNALHTMYAGILLDFGNSQHNNFLTNATIVPEVLTQSYPQLVLNTNGTVSVVGRSQSSLYQMVTNTFPGSTLKFPLDGSQPSTLQVPFLCHFAAKKSTGSLIIAVLVATLSMFSAGWAVFMLIATYFANRNHPEANYCDYHVGKSPLDGSDYAPNQTQERLSLKEYRDR